MTADTGRWLLVALAVLGLAVAVPAVSAHGSGTATPTNATATNGSAHDAPATNATADDWATWMEWHMTQHMGPDAAEWMAAHDVHLDGMARIMANSTLAPGEYGPMVGHGHAGAHGSGYDAGVSDGHTHADGGYGGSTHHGAGSNPTDGVSPGDGPYHDDGTYQDGTSHGGMYGHGC